MIIRRRKFDFKPVNFVFLVKEVSIKSSLKGYKRKINFNEVVQSDQGIQNS